MSSIMALFPNSPRWMWAVVLAGFLPVSALSESALAQSTPAAQAVAWSEPHSQTGAAVAGTSTVLKTSITTAQPVPLKDTKIDTVASMSAPNPGAKAASAVQPQVDGIELLSPAQQRAYQRASLAFTGFCHDWERLLHEREVDNLQHLSWREDGGLETASYTGYGKVESCECKASKEGLPIGKIRYEEINYSIAGKTIEQARHAVPRLMHEINTLEIFSWDKGKWFY